MYVGPYLVIRYIEPVNFVLQKSAKSKPFVAHANKLKKCYGETPLSWLPTANWHNSLNIRFIFICTKLMKSLYWEVKMCTKNEGQLISFCYMNMTGELYKEDAGFRFLLEHRFHYANLARGVKKCARNRRIKKTAQQFYCDANDVSMRCMTNFLSCACEECQLTLVSWGHGRT